VQYYGCDSGPCEALVGLRRNIAGQFTNWLDGTPFDETAYANWNAGEPNSPGRENCVELVKNSGKWNDIACGNNRLAVCEKPRPAASGQCASGWSPFGQSCYGIITSAQSFDVHRASCESLGGWLVSINYAEENDFVNREI
ncbi:Macrophage mannose receptor 1, partial [Aphelenchoides avenae]